jgi:DNA-binding CsgD family transcriptional regulator
MMQHVVAYYKEHGTSNEQMEAYYLLGSVYRDLHEAPRAMEAFLNGISAADTTSTECNYHLLARLYGQKCDILYRQSLYRQASETERLVYKYAMLAHDTIYMVAAQWGRLGKCYAINDYQTIADECWKILEESKKLGVFSYSAKHLCTSVLANVEIGRVEDAQKLLSIYEQHSGCVDLTTHECSFPVYYSAKGRVLAAKGQLDSAEYFFRKELKAQNWNNRQGAYRGLRMVFEQKGLKDSICKYAPLQCDAVDSAYQEMLSQNLQNLHEMYDYNRLQTENSQKELQLQESRRKALYTWRLLAFVILSGLFLFFFLRSWYKQRIANAELKLERANAKLEERENNLAALREELENVADEKERLRLAKEVEQAEKETDQQRKVVMNDQERLDELRQRVRTNSKTLRQQFCMIPLFQTLLRKARNNNIATLQDYDLIQKALSEKDAELLNRFYMLLPNLSETELQVFLLLRIGMTKTEISLLTAHSQAAVTNTCTRLFYKVHGRKCSTSAEAYEWLLNL